MPKRTIYRKQYIALRGQMSKEDVLTKSVSICDKVLHSAVYKQAQEILAYYPLGNEVNCLPVLEDALKHGKRVMLPRTAMDSQMDFYEIHSLTDVEEGHFHVMEPKVSCKKFEADRRECKSNVFSMEDLQNESEILVLVPGVVFDCNGNRYGYGKGYYDRYFSRFPYLKRVALAYSEQVSQEPLECLETDVKMHAIVTEREWLVMDQTLVGKKIVKKI